MLNTLESPGIAWLLLFSAFFCIVFRIQRESSIGGILVLWIVLNTDIGLHPQIASLWGNQNSVWFDPNASSVALVILNLAIPKIVLIGSWRIKRTYFYLISTIAIILSMSVMAILLWVIALFIVFWERLLIKQRNYLLFTIPLSLVFLYHHILHSLQVRVELWNTGLRTFYLNPFIGSGLKGFKNHFFGLRTERYGQLKGTYTLESDPHDLLLNSLISFGLVVTIIIIALIGVIYYRRRAELTSIGKSGLIIFLLQSFVNINSVIVNLSLLLVLLYSGVKNREKISVNFPEKPKNPFSSP